MIELTINGRSVQLQRPMTIRELLDSRNLHDRIVVVEHNREIIPRDLYDVIVLGPSDNVEIVQMMAGG